MSAADIYTVARDEWEYCRNKHPRTGEPSWSDLSAGARLAWITETARFVNLHRLVRGS